jgi:Holliday junction resolvase-like predicted endonuclease
MRDLTNASKGQLGEKVVRTYLEEEGYTVRTSSKNGSDLVATKKGQEPFFVEVKASGNLKGRIPDMHTAEFCERNGKWYLVADYLYVVRLDGSGEPIQIDILSKAEVDSYNDSHRLVT